MFSHPPGHFLLLVKSSKMAKKCNNRNARFPVLSDPFRGESDAPATRKGAGNKARTSRKGLNRLASALGASEGPMCPAALAPALKTLGQVPFPTSWRCLVSALASGGCGNIGPARGRRATSTGLRRDSTAGRYYNILISNNRSRTPVISY